MKCPYIRPLHLSPPPPPPPLLVCVNCLITSGTGLTNSLFYATANTYRNLPKVYQYYFFRNMNSKHLSLILTIFDFSENIPNVSNNFRKILMKVFTKYYFPCIFNFHRLFLRTFELIKLCMHELKSRGSYIPIHKSIRRPAVDQSDFSTASPPLMLTELHIINYQNSKAL